MLRPLLCLVAFAALAAPASATTVSWIPPPPDNAPTPEESCSRYSQCPTGQVSVAGGAGERNDISFDASPPAGRVVVRDAGASLNTSAPCELIENGAAVSCPADGVATVAGNDGDDRIVAPQATVEGGDGNDVLTGATVDGGAGDDVIDGTSGPNVLTGGPGADILDGGPGPDTLDGGAGTDRILGGGGNDVITSRDRRRERISCGRGRDRVSADRGDRLTGCERVRRR